MIISYYIALKVMYKKQLHLSGTNILNAESWNNFHWKHSLHSDTSPLIYDEAKKGPV